MTSTFDGFYFYWERHPNTNYMVVKFGDTKRKSVNATNYRYKRSLFIHQNNNSRSIGKYLQNNVLGKLVKKNMALQIQNIRRTESYIVTVSTFNTLHKNYEKIAKNYKSYTSKEDIEGLADQVINEIEKRIIKEYHHGALLAAYKESKKKDDKKHKTKKKSKH
jgi:hypothetical protein